MCLPVVLLVVLVCPGLVLAAVVVWLGEHGPLGMAAAALLLVGLTRGSLWSLRAFARWWSRLGPVR